MRCCTFHDKKIPGGMLKNISITMAANDRLQERMMPLN
jgi:hypothetical protein